MPEQICDEPRTNLNLCYSSNGKDDAKCKEFLNKLTECRENHDNNTRGGTDNKEEV